MRWQFWQKPAPIKLTPEVRNILTKLFQLDSQMLDQLRVTSKGGRYSNRRVQYFRIFDPSLVAAGDVAALRYEDLAETTGHRRALLFDGHIEKDDFGGRVDQDSRVNLRDRRIP